MDTKTKSTIDAYDKFAGQYSQFSYSTIPQYELEQFVSMIPKKSAILDIGCGSGRDTDFFVKEGFNVTGIDASSKLLAEAKKNISSKKASFKKMDVNSLKFKKDSFDGIWSSNTFSHIRKKELHDVLLKLRQILKKEGVIFFDVIQGEGEKSIKSKEVGFMPRFFSLYLQDEIEAAVKEAGFFINSVYTTRTDDHVFINIFARNVN